MIKQLNRNFPFEPCQYLNLPISQFANISIFQYLNLPISQFANISLFKGKNICCNTNFSGSKLTKLYHFVYIPPQNCSTIILNNDIALGVPG